MIIQEDTMKRLTCAAICGAIVSIIFTAAITIGGELYLPLKDWLKNVFSHHWLGKSVLSIAVFIVSGAVGYPFLKNTDSERLANRLWLLFWVTILATGALVGFYIYEYLKH